MPARPFLTLFPVILSLLALSVGCEPDVGLVKSQIDADGDGYTEDVDCDDAHYFVNPDAPELCDGFDNDCDGTIDVDATDARTYYDDLDGDGFGDPERASQLCAPESDQVDDGTDCDDTEPTAHPGGDELCDGLDNDCDDQIDENATDPGTWYQDADEDGYGNELAPIEACDLPEGYVADATDCDDENPAIHPDASEDDCTDPTDYNCDGSVGWADADGDGAAACEDCDDADPARSPHNSEICDDADIDEDCNTLADDDDPDTDPDSMSDWYRDADRDGYSAGTGTPLTQCEQPTGYTDLLGDCDDTDRSRSPGATEVCDAWDTDEDCDLLSDDDDPDVDAGTWSDFYRDADGDTYGDASRSVSLCDAPANYVSNSTDCDDTNAARNPGASEVCDASNIDEDCDLLADDADTGATGMSTWYLDSDSDSYGLSASALVRCDRPTGYAAASGDCDDTSPVINPAGAEICDSLNADEDCDGAADDADSSVSGKSTWYRDYDVDGYGTTSSTTTACDRPTGYASSSTDCNDLNATINPGASEVCDALNTDEDCDFLADDADPGVTGRSTWYRDADSDTYGSTTTTTTLCDMPSGYVARGGDCDDATSARSPANAEICDALNVDEDCDSLADDADPSVTGGTTWYRDADGDTYGGTTTTTACDLTTGWVARSGDCNDALATINPGASEVCDASDLDEDCDGLADDLDGSVTGRTTWYQDFDSDSYGTSTTTSVLCNMPSGFVAVAGDCNDSLSTVSPGASEVCDASNVDEDCDLLADDADPSATGKSTWYRDADSDTYGTTTSTTSACDLPAGHRAVAGDCNDAVAAINPAATEVCDPLDTDEDCDGLVDDADPSATGKTTFYLDSDRDSYGSATTASRCDGSSTYVTTGGDCDDSVSTVHPGAAEDCRTSTDDDCSGDTNGRDGTGCTDFYADLDDDGFGAGTAQCWCAATATYSVTDDGDCDDTEVTAYPGGSEICGDSVDQDCSGADLSCPTGNLPEGDISCDAITTRVEAYASNYYLGSRGADFADFNGDGHQDLLVSATGPSTGMAWLFRGPLEGSYLTDGTDPTATLYGSVSADYAYVTGRIGDHDGDGREDFAIGAVGWDGGGSSAGGVFVLPGSASGAISLTTAYPTFVGEAASYGLGNAVAPAGDVDDDGYDDFLVASSSYGSTQSGKVYLLHGPFAVGSRAASTYATSTWVGEASSNYAGSTVVGDVDLNNDGEEDLLIGANGYGSYAGRVYVYYGPFHTGSVTLNSTTADAVITGKAASDYMGYQRAIAVVPDMNGDGYDEVAVGAYQNDDAASNAGKAYVFYGPLSGSLSTSDADITVSGVAASDYCGLSVGGVEDIDGDGGGELLVGCQGYDYGSVSNVGAGLLFYSGSTGDLDVLDADAMFYGTTSSDYAGLTVGSAGDFDEDGTPDIYVAAVYDEYTSGLSNSGILYLVPGDLDNKLVNGADVSVSGASNTGWRVSRAGDYNNDGYDDVVSSTYSSTTTYVEFFMGPLYAGMPSSATITSDASGDYLGSGLDGGGHINSDVYDDTIVGAYAADSGGTNYGEVYVISGRSTPISFTAGTSAFANFYGASASEYLGYSVSVVYDWDGDGMDDVLMGAYGYSSSTGRAFLVTAPTTGTAGTVTSYADSSFTSLSTGVNFAISVDGDGDVDGDGYADVLIGASGWDLPTSNNGAAFLYYGGANAAFTTSTADAEILGEATGDGAGIQVSILGDTNNDGYDDLLIGATGTDRVGTSSGTAYLVLGPITSDLGLDDADARLDGAMSGEGLGAYLDGAGDIDGDGYDDWLAGTATGDRGFTDGGTVYFVRGPESGVLTPFQWHGPYSSSYAGACAGVGDTNNDGYDDYLIGGYGRSNLWLFRGP